MNASAYSAATVAPRKRAVEVQCHPIKLKSRSGTLPVSGARVHLFRQMQRGASTRRDPAQGPRRRHLVAAQPSAAS